MRKAYNIEWDTDGQEVDLPKEIEIPENILYEEDVSDYLTEKTGFCHKGFETNFFFETMYYKGIAFPVRACYFHRNKRYLEKMIGSELMDDILLDENRKPRDKDTEIIDDQISYYVEHDVLLNYSDEEILEYIHQYIDPDIYQEFD